MQDMRNKKECKTMLLKTIDVLGVSLTAEEKKLDPSKIASLGFSKAFDFRVSKTPLHKYGKVN